MSRNIFEYATKNKLRFPYKGSVSVEDLWDLSLIELDGIFKTLNAKAKANSEESLLADKSDTDTALEVQIEIVKHIVSSKLAAQESAMKAADTKAKKQHILSIIAAKKDEALQNSSIEDLEKMLSEIDG